MTAPNPTANIEVLAAGLLVLDGLARQSFDRLARSQSGPRRLAWPRTSPFHGGNTGSNPVGDAKFQASTQFGHDEVTINPRFADQRAPLTQVQKMGRSRRNTRAALPRSPRTRGGETWPTTKVSLSPKLLKSKNDGSFLSYITHLQSERGLSENTVAITPETSAN